MAFASTILNEDGAPEVVGTMKVMYGTFTAQTAGSNVQTSGEIDTGLTANMVHMNLQYIQTPGETLHTAGPSAPAAPSAGPTVDVNVLTNSRGSWCAWFKP